MYSHHHYNYENLSRDNANAQPLGRPASMPSIYQSGKDLDVEPNTRSSLDISTTSGPYANAGSWQPHHNSGGWNHNQQDATTENSSLNNSPPNKDVLPSIDKSTTSSIISTYHSPTYFVSPSTNSTASNGTPVYNNNGQYHNSHHSTNYSSYGMTSGLPNQPRHSLVARPKLTTTLWEDEGTICYQVDANGICVARRQDNDMINGTKLLNVAGMSRGKRDGILKNEKGRVVVKVGAMHLKGVWITFARAKLLAAQYKIQEILYPLFVDDPSVFLYATALHNPMATSRMNNLNTFNNRQSNFHIPTTAGWDNKATTNASNENHSSYRNAGFHNGSMMNPPMNSHSDDMFILSSQVDYNRQALGGYNSHYSLYPQQQQQQERRLYFTDDLLDDNKSDNNNLSNESNATTTAATSIYGQKPTMLPGATTFSSPTSSEAGTPTPSTATTTTNERRQSLVMSSSRATTSPRHHPYMSPGKVYTPSIMSSLQSYRHNEENRSILNDTSRASIDNNSTTGTDRHPW